MRKLTIAILLTLLAALWLVAPATPVSAAPPMLPGMDEMMQQVDQDVAKLQGLSGKDFEVAFLEMMIPHHESAMMMAQLVPSRATHPEIKTLAQQIIASQQQEIAQMSDWLNRWYGITSSPAMPMAGMDKMMAAMQGMTGAEFEQAFLMMMPMHHMGASSMAALAPGRATNPELLQLAQNIVTTQGQEIEQMRQWALAWYGFDPMPMNPGGTPMPGLPNTGGGGAPWQSAGVQAAIVALAAALLALPLGLLRRRRLARYTR